MDEKTRRKVVDAATKIWMDQGKIIEAGWAGYRITCLAKDAPPAQLLEMRMTFFAGAQHLFGSISSVLDPGDEPTEDDMKRMDMIQKELDLFIQDFKLRYFPTQGRS